MNEKIYNRTIKFMNENNIKHEETINQCDWVIENAYSFITDLFNIVKEDLDIVEDEI